jgi:hypothetical protein
VGLLKQTFVALKFAAGWGFTVTIMLSEAEQLFASVTVKE